MLDKAITLVIVGFVSGVWAYAIGAFLENRKNIILTLFLAATTSVITGLLSDNLFHYSQPLMLALILSFFIAILPFEVLLFHKQENENRYLLPKYYFIFVASLLFLSII